MLLDMAGPLRAHEDMQSMTGDHHALSCLVSHFRNVHVPKSRQYGTFLLTEPFFGNGYIPSVHITLDMDILQSLMDEFSGYSHKIC